MVSQLSIFSTNRPLHRLCHKRALRTKTKNRLWDVIKLITTNSRYYSCFAFELCRNIFRNLTVYRSSLNFTYVSFFGFFVFIIIYRENNEFLNSKVFTELTFFPRIAPPSRPQAHSQTRREGYVLPAIKTIFSKIRSFLRKNINVIKRIIWAATISIQK